MTEGLSCMTVAYSCKGAIAVALKAGGVTLKAGGVAFNVDATTHYVGVPEEYAVSGFSGRKTVFS